MFVCPITLGLNVGPNNRCVGYGEQLTQKVGPKSKQMISKHPIGMYNDFVWQILCPRQQETTEIHVYTHHSTPPHKPSSLHCFTWLGKADNIIKNHSYPAHTFSPLSLQAETKMLKAHIARFKDGYFPSLTRLFNIALVYQRCIPNLPIQFFAGFHTLTACSVVALLYSAVYFLHCTS